MVPASKPVVCVPCGLQVMGKMLPRHMEIIEIINDGWVKWVEKKTQSKAKAEAMAIVHPNPWNNEEWCVARSVSVSVQ